MESKPLREQIAAMRQSFFDEEILDSQFLQLEMLEKENPNFVEEVLTMFFRDSAKLITAVENAMETTPNEFAKVDKMLHQLKGSSASIGANKVRNELTVSRSLWQQGDVEGAKAAFQGVRREHGILKAKLEPYFQQLRQAGPAETATPPQQ